MTNTGIYINSIRYYEFDVSSLEMKREIETQKKKHKYSQRKFLINYMFLDYYVN